MGTAPLPVNTAADVLNQAIGILMTGGEKAAEEFLYSLDPALAAFPPVKWIIDNGVEYLGQIVSIAGQKFADAAVIDIQTKGQQSNVVNGGVALQLALGSGDKDAIAKAAGTLSGYYKALVHFDGVATPK